MRHKQKQNKVPKYTLKAIKKYLKSEKGKASRRRYYLKNKVKILQKAKEKRAIIKKAKSSGVIVVEFD